MNCEHEWKKHMNEGGRLRCRHCRVIGIRRGKYVRTFMCTRCGTRKSTHWNGGEPVCVRCEAVRFPVRMLSRGDFSAAEIAAMERQYGARVMARVA